MGRKNRLRASAVVDWSGMSPSGTRVMRYESCIMSHASPHRLALIIVVIAKHSFENRGRRKIILAPISRGRAYWMDSEAVLIHASGLRAAAMACKSPPVSGGSSTTALAYGPTFGSSVLTLANRLKIKTASQGTDRFLWCTVRSVWRRRVTRRVVPPLL